MGDSIIVNRRNFLLAASGAFLTGCAAGGCGGSGYVGFASFPCSDRLPGGIRLYRVNLDRFPRQDLQEQKGDELCWAAAIQAMMTYQGYRLSQEDVVQKVRGAYSKNGYSSATLREIIRGVGGPGRGWHVNNGNSNALVLDLMAGNPVIMGLKSGDSGHVVVVYGARYVHNRMDNRYYIDSVRLWDPWYGQGRKSVDGCEIRDRKKFALHSARCI